MTDTTDDLVKRLRAFDWRGKVRTATAHEAADRIEFLEEWVEANTRKIDRYWKALKLIADQGGQTESRIARAALGDTQ